MNTTQNTVDLKLTEMSCQGCVESVKRVLAQVPGVKTVSVEIGKARVVLSDGDAGFARVTGALAKAGYGSEKERV